MKILFIQLPLLDHGRFYLGGNINYGPAAISAFLKTQFMDRVSIELLPFVLENFSSNDVIAKYVEKLAPDIISFSSYLWNVERNLDIAEKIRLLNKKCTIIFGGPEINADSWILSEKRKCVDFFVSGEGEWFFREYIKNQSLSFSPVKKNGNQLIEQTESDLIREDEIVEPLTGNMINAMPDGSVFMELVRGCPYRCIYCYYSKNCLRVREIPFDTLLKALSLQENRKIREIYILAPNFNRVKNFRERLKILISKNSGIRLHTEMRAEGIDTETAADMYAAGFRSLEVGLQTLNSRSLKAIKRHSNVEAELAGMLELKGAGIELKIGIIPGLPDDNPSEFEKTIQRLVKLGFEEEIELYPLMILPGTELREMADKEGVRYQSKPPYYYLEGFGFGYDDIKKGISELDYISGFSYTVKQLPDFFSSKDGILIGGFRVESDDLNRCDKQYLEENIETNVFHIFIMDTKKSVLEENIESFLKILSFRDELFNIIIESEHILEEDSIIRIIGDLERDSFYQRLRIFNEWKDALRVQFYQVFEDPESFIFANERYVFVEPVLKLTCDNYSTSLDLLDEAPENILIARGVYNKVKKYLIKTYSDYVENVAFEDKAEHEDFYRSMQHEYVNLPFDFRVVNFPK